MVSGYVNTSHGKVETDIAQSITFANAQTYNVYIDGSVYDQTSRNAASRRGEAKVVGGAARPRLMNGRQRWSVAAGPCVTISQKPGCVRPSGLGERPDRHPDGLAASLSAPVNVHAGDTDSPMPTA